MGVAKSQCGGQGAWHTVGAQLMLFLLLMHTLKVKKRFQEGTWLLLAPGPCNYIQVPCWEG